MSDGRRLQMVEGVEEVLVALVKYLDTADREDMLSPRKREDMGKIEESWKGRYGCWYVL